MLNSLPGDYAIGHNRYSTTGENTLRNIQPFFADTNAGGIGVAHNGNLTNSITLRNRLVQDGAIFHTTSDTETIVQLIAKSKRNKTIDKVIDAIIPNTRWLRACHVNTKYFNWCKRSSWYQTISDWENQR